jgi:MFS family permease
MPPVPRHILPVIVLAELAGTALWFSGNAILPDLQRQWGLGPDAIGSVTVAVQAGFIAGTLVFAALAIADRYSPRLIFLACTVLGALANAALLLAPRHLAPLLALRLATGFFLAGIYPVGMKIAAGWFDRDLGRALGWLVGALVVGTALPHLVRGLGAALPWQGVILATSAFALAGGSLMAALVPDGPHLKPGRPFSPTALVEVFRQPGFRAASFGYFGHMWELYAFWAFLPHVIAWRAAEASDGANVPLLSFLVIAIGAFGCIVGGQLSLRLGSARVASAQLAASGAFCLASPLLLSAPFPVMLAGLLVWGIVVVGDSPQFSTLNARHAPPHLVGSALTIANCIGFAITIVSIDLVARLLTALPPQYLFLLLLPGPILGLWALRPLLAGPLAERPTA